MTERQHQIALGALLGDAWIDKDRLRLKQCDRYKEYVFWLYEELQDLCLSPPKQRKDNLQWYFQTRKNEEIIKYRKIFYRNAKKIIPQEIGKLLIHPLSLAVWFMDDGTLDWRIKDHYAFRLATYCFTLDECNQLVDTLENNFGVSASVQTTLMRGKRLPRIHIGKEGRENFRKLISPYLVHCFSYKLPSIISNPSETVLLTSSQGDDSDYPLKGNSL